MESQDDNNVHPDQQRQNNMTAAGFSVWGSLGPHFRLRVPMQDTDPRTDRDVNVFTVRQGNHTGMGPHLHLRPMSIRGVQESGKPLRIQVQNLSCDESTLLRLTPRGCRLLVSCVQVESFKFCAPVLSLKRYSYGRFRRPAQHSINGEIIPLDLMNMENEDDNIVHPGQQRQNNMTAAGLSVWGSLGPHFRLRIPVRDTDPRTDRDVHVFTVRQGNHAGMGPHLHLRPMSIRGVQESGQGPSVLYCG